MGDQWKCKSAWLLRLGLSVQLSLIRSQAWQRAEAALELLMMGGAAVGALFCSGILAVKNMLSM